jgi:ribosomal protein S12 methylthiotransferase
MNYRIVSLGCPKNLVDSEYIAGRLEQAGHVLSDDAELVVINTCAFIADACSESIETILEEAQKCGDGRRRLVVTGCLVDRYGAELKKLLPEVDVFVDSRSYEGIETLAAGEKGATGHRGKGPAAVAPAATARRVLTPVPTTYLKIQEGCNNRCAYCTIPSIRGPLRSRTPADIEAEFAGLLEQGFREINIVGQDITSYGKDAGDDIKALVRRLTRAKGDYFIRLLYMHPKGIDDELLEIIARDAHIIKYLDIPVQHSEDAILASMNRGYTRADLTRLFTRIKEIMPDAALRTTIMVGYPGETAGDFANLCAFVAETRFDNLGAFIYSREKGTRADRITGHVRKAVKRERYRAVMELQQGISKERLGRLVGRTEKVIVEAREAGATTGRLLVQAPDVDGIAFIRGDCRPGEIREGIVTGTLDYDVIIDLGGTNGTHQ